MSGFYARLREERKYDPELQHCIESVARQLGELQSNRDRPGMLLGKIQSGKTRAFLGVIAKAFDEGFDIAVVLTKGTVTLSSQTVKRFTREYKPFVDGEEAIVFDIMAMPPTLTRPERRRKMVIVAKKQVRNLEKLLELFDTKYPELKDKKILLVDDEADMASIRFIRRRGTEDIEQGRIAQQMDLLRTTVQKIAFLQVTATPYSLYLQPPNYEIISAEDYIFLPKRPAFTELLPIHQQYVGGEDYFGDFDDDNPRSYLYVEVPPDEQDALRRNDGRSVRSDRLYTSENIRALRRALVTFILAVATRRWQQTKAELPRQKYAMVIHNDTQRHAHRWQCDIVTRLVDTFTESAENNDTRLRNLFDEAFVDLSRSVAADGGTMPSPDEAYRCFVKMLLDGDVHPERVNSDVKPLLDPDTAELNLRTAANIFIGGSILDRGITIPNLISFYYGRNPRTMQADTVLQHSRMYGARDLRDLAVTRFFTSRVVYERLRRIHELEVALREAFARGAHDRGVAFVRLDEHRTITPCAPNKVMLSDLVAIRPGGRLLPVGFQSGPKTKIERIVNGIDAMIPAEWHYRAKQELARVPTLKLHEIIAKIAETLDFEDANWDWNAFHAAIDFFARMNPNVVERDMVLVAAWINREGNRMRSGGRFANAPDSKQQREAAEFAQTMPILCLLRHSGSKDEGWGGHPFWWPVLFAPREAAPVVYAAIDPSQVEGNAGGGNSLPANGQNPASPQRRVAA